MRGETEIWASEEESWIRESLKGMKVLKTMERWRGGRYGGRGERGRRLFDKWLVLRLQAGVVRVIGFQERYT
jgi:hypothetical protein